MKKSKQYTSVRKHRSTSTQRKKIQSALPPVPLTGILPPKPRSSTKKGTYGRRIIAVGSDDKYNYMLHATKGYRRVVK